MTGWFRDPELAGSERVRFRRAANLRQGWRSVGGEVSVTDRRLLFTPNLLEHLTRGRPVAVALTDVAAVTVVPPGPAAVRQAGLGALLRPHVRVETPGGPLVLALAEPDALLRVLEAPGG